MYKSDYFTEEQMTMYEMRSDPNKAWTPTLDHFSLLFAQRKAYGDDRAVHSGFESVTTMMFDTPLIARLQPLPATAMQPPGIST